MAIVTKTIGTSSRDYSTQQAWEDDLDNGAIYSAGDDAVGECYNDSVFDEIVTINGGATIGLNSRILTVASGERHDGTEGTGVRNVPTTTASNTYTITGAITTTVRWLEIDGGAQNILCLLDFSGLTFSTSLTLDHLIVHDIVRTDGASGGVNPSGIFGNGVRAAAIFRCIVYNIHGNRGGATPVVALSTDHDVAHSGILNCTVYNTQQLNASSTASVDGIQIVDTNTGYGCVNNISIGTATAGSGTALDFNPSSPSTVDMDHNASSDSSASGTGSLTSQTAANLFTSTTPGSINLHLKTGANAIDAGSDLATTPTGVNIDIDGYDVDAAAVTWDMGADEYVAAGGRIMGSLAGLGGLAGMGGLAGQGGGLAG